MEKTNERRHVVITGASSGIGEALVREFAGPYTAITMVARRGELLKRIAESVTSKTLTLSVDLSVLEESTAWLAEAEARFGPIDLLINNAGSQVIAPFEETDVAKTEMSLRLNLLSPLRITRAVLPGMLARGRGTVINIASLAALAPLPGMCHYSASKAGLAAASEAMRGELLGSGVKVLTVYPGPIKTPMGDAAVVKYGRSASWAPTGTAEKLARKIRRAVERGQGRLIYPGVYQAARYFPAATRFLVDCFTPRVVQATAGVLPGVLPGGV